MNINIERLVTSFITMCEIDSPSRHEKDMSSYLQKTFSALGADSIEVDNSATETGSETGNLIVRFSGNDREPLFFCCHMDTVEPGRNIEVGRKGDIFFSKGDTILGADDKTGIAALIELVTLLKENGLSHRPFELVFTTCEEIGLLGAKALNPALLQSKYGFALDSTGPEDIVTGAPAANRIKITVRGKAAHSGLNPESGINALSIAAEAISKLPMGRIDEITTCNLGLINGGTATNIVPELVTLEGEVRSHSDHKLEEITNRIIEIFETVARNWPLPQGCTDIPEIIAEVEKDFPLIDLAENSLPLVHIREAEQKLNKKLTKTIAGGGSDANIFCGYGLPAAILATGMMHVHTTDEQADLTKMIQLTELLIALVAE